MPSIAIVEDHLLLAETLRGALVGEGVDAVIVAPCEPALLVGTLRRMGPALVLLDLDLGAHGDSTCVIGPLAAANIRTLVVSGTSEREHIALAFEAGAVGFHAKSDGFQCLITKAIEALVCVAPLDDELRRGLRDELARARSTRSVALAPFLRLTAREAATLESLRDGLSVHAIAAEWVISEATVRTHVRGILVKLHAPSQLAAVAMASRCGWLSADRDLAATW